ncbi:uncharacterized protein DUF3152 [Murinocardiopsis flavida]|uniref:Uncharacterized protein DUF3152 n=1 Tax=Murinocardiopsis flavida TaxID=645275 RepID=A0A2P8DED8_9ACTN|nr:DUF3152 domain-containing protein [Murinocardiopsis flavida]PSK95578.1 uncharacterized protein DUF3152 [Murinocardiopsis flavida]
MSRTGSSSRYRARSAYRSGSTPRGRHHRRRRYPFAVLLALAVVAASVTVLASGPVQDTQSRMREGEPQAADYQRSHEEKEPDDAARPAPSPSPVPVLKRSVVKEVRSGKGDLKTVGGTSGVAGKGPLKRYAVEVEEGLPGKPADFAAAVEQILGDPRSWGNDGDMAFQRVGSTDDAEIRVALASPETVDRMCAPLSTNGVVSCTQGKHVIINQNRWVSGVPHFKGDLDTYRVYVINHEVGHALGHGHVDCDGSGLAPVMQQQTFSLKGCKKNGWVHP